MAALPVWHFARPQLAATTLATLQTGLAASITLVSPRQMGKSDFLQQDLVTQATELGWRVRYFACAGVSPRALLRRLDEALADFAAGEKWLMRQLARLTQPKPTAPLDFSQRLMQELSQLRGEKKPSLMLLDDVDRVMQLPQGDALLRDILRAFAATHGQARLLMSATQHGGGQTLPLPLLQQTTVLNLPDIGDAFVQHMVAHYQRLTQSKRKEDNAFGQFSSPYQGITWGQINEPGLLDAFNRLQRIPYYFRALVEDLVLNPDRSPAEALQMQLTQLQRHRVSALSWEEMSRLDRLLVMQIAQGSQRFYGAELRQQLAGQSGVANISTSQIQSSLKKLLRNRVLAQEGEGRYQIIDPHLAAALAIPAA